MVCETMPSESSSSRTLPIWWSSQDTDAKYACRASRATGSGSGVVTLSGHTPPVELLKKEWAIHATPGMSGGGSLFAAST